MSHYVELFSSLLARRLYYFQGPMAVDTGDKQNDVGLTDHVFQNMLSIGAVSVMEDEVSAQVMDCFTVFGFQTIKASYHSYTHALQRTGALFLFCAVAAISLGILRAEESEYVTSLGIIFFFRPCVLSCGLVFIPDLHI
jgi:hypothetical protein